MYHPFFAIVISTSEIIKHYKEHCFLKKDIKKTFIMNFCEVYNRFKKINECTDEDCSEVLDIINVYLHCYLHVFVRSEAFERYLVNRWMFVYNLIVNENKSPINSIVLGRVRRSDIPHYQNKAIDFFNIVAA